MRLHTLTFKLHRWLAYAVGLQLVIWVIGGVGFALMPFQDWVKSAATVRKPTVDYPLSSLAKIAALDASTEQLRIVAGPYGTVLSVKTPTGLRCFDVTGAQSPPPSAESIAALGGRLYRGEGTLLDVALTPASKRWLIVDEMAGQEQLWRVRFNDALGTRLYFGPECGEFLFAKNAAWVVYDFLWRLHIMDYGGGEDFNNPLLRVFSVAGLILALSGAVLALLAVRRNWTRHRP